MENTGVPIHTVLNWPERFDSSDSGISDIDVLDQDDGKFDNARNETTETARHLATWVIAEMTNDSTACSIPDGPRKYIPTMRKLISRIMDTNGKIFRRMVEQLNVGNVNSSKYCLKRVANELFIDRKYNWGRIITLYAFAGEMANTLQAKYGSEVNEKIAEELGFFISQELSEWIAAQGGWGALNEFFAEENQSESKLWKGLLYTMLGIGAIATTALVIR